MSTANTTLLNQPGVLQTGVPLQGSITTTGTIYTSGSNTITLNPNGWGSSNGTWTVGAPSYYPYTPSVSYPSQSIIFKIEEGSEKDENTLINRFNDILNDEIHFFPLIEGKKIEPLETVMKYIKSQMKMDLKLTRVGYDIKIKGVTFKSIRNLLSKDSDTVLKVVFEYEELVYDNTLLTLEEKRSLKVKELAKNIKKNDI